MATIPAVSSSPRRREVAEILGDFNQGRHYPKVTRVIPVRHILVFEQTRKTFDSAYIAWLANEIETDGLNNPLQVVRYSPEHFSRFLKALNLVWRTKYRRSQFKPINDHGRLWYYALIAGECRIRALRRIGTDLVQVTLGTNTPPKVALKEQQIENQYNPPPTHEQAFAWQRMFTVLRMAEPGLSLAAFARFANKNPGTVRKALQFCDLPDEVQFMVQRGDLKYGIALQLIRLNEYRKQQKPDAPAHERVEKTELIERAQTAAVHQLKVVKFRTQIGDRLIELRSGQSNLFMAVAAIDDFKQQQRLERRKTAAKQYVYGLTLFAQYMATIGGLVRDGQLGGRDAPLADYSVRKKMRQVLDALEENLEVLELVMRHVDRERAKAIIFKGRSLLDRADKVLGKETVLTEEMA